MSAKGTSPNIWTEADTAYLRKAYAKGVDVAIIAKRLKRDKSAIYSRAKYLFILRDWELVNKTKWAKRDIKFIQKNFHELTNTQLAAALEKKLTVVRNKCRELGLLHLELEYWTPEQVEYLKANYKQKGDVELAEYFNSIKSWKKKKGWTKKHIEKKRRYLNMKRTNEEQLAIKNRNIAQGRFSISHWKRWINLEAEIGEIRIWQNQKGNLFKVIKTEEGFVHLAPYMYRLHHGKIKKGHMISFKDFNPLNCAPENLIQISRREKAMQTVANHSRAKSDQYLAGIMARGDQEFKKQLLNNPDLLQIKRMQLINNQQINKLYEAA